jgi:Trk K+ transport system NAD-binding subunit
MCAEQFISIRRSVDPSLLGVKIQFNSVYCGNYLADIPVPKNCVILGCLRSQEVISMSENPLINIGDYILALTLHPMIVPELKFMLKKTCPVYYSLNDCPLEY